MEPLSRNEAGSFRLNAGLATEFFRHENTLSGKGSLGTVLWLSNREIDSMTSVFGDTGDPGQGGGRTSCGQEEVRLRYLHERIIDPPKFRQFEVDCPV